MGRDVNQPVPHGIERLPPVRTRHGLERSHQVGIGGPHAERRHPVSDPQVHDDGLHVNGALTLGENIADLTGLVISRQAYLLSLKGKDAPTIDGLTGDQRFYMGWAQSWMAKERDESLRQQVLTNVHSSEMYRANGPIRNIPEFYAAFGVKEGDKLYLPPDRRVKIW